MHAMGEETVEQLGRLDILVNNAAVQQYNNEARMCAFVEFSHHALQFETLKEEQILHTFRTNIIGCMFLAQAALPHLKEGATFLT